MSSIFSGMTSLIQAELEIQTAAIEKRYDKEISQAEGNNYKVKKLEEQKQKELAKKKNEANKKMFAMQVIQAVAQTAQNAISAYGSAAAIRLWVISWHQWLLQWRCCRSYSDCCNQKAAASE